jgi:glycogen synthase
MKILCAIDSLHGGGAETSLVDMVPALRERNVHLSLVTLLPDDDALTARIQEPEVPIRRLAGYSWPGRFAELRRELHRRRPDLLHTSLARSDLVGRAGERRGAVRTALGIPAEAPLVLIVGRLDVQKAVDIGLRAVGILQRTVPHVQTLVAGRDGDAAREVHELAASMRNVHMLGHRTDVPDLMCAADCLCLPSRWEGLRGTLIEAMALELPVVASDIGPIREMLGDVGWPLATVDDEHTVAAGLRCVLAGGQAVAEKVADGRRRFESTFTMTSVADGMVELYSRAIAQARR